jgi:hypothetical protein
MSDMFPQGEGMSPETRRRPREGLLLRADVVSNALSGRLK